MTRNKAARKAATNRAKMCPSKHDQIITEEYKRGTWWAAWVLFGMFVFMSLGSVMFGW